VDSLLQDLRHAIRSLRRAPVLSLTAVVTLALGIGVNSAIFGVIDSLFFRTPPHVVEPERLVRLNSSPGSVRAYPRLQDLEADASGFSGVAAYYGPRTLSLGRGESAQSVQAELATAGFFPLLGVAPLRGRWFTAEEDRPGRAADVVVVSREFWNGSLGAAEDVLGKPLQIGQRVYTIVGVAPAEFSGVELRRPDVWLPMSAAAPEVVWEDILDCIRCSWLQPIARLATGVAPEGAAREATAIYRRRVAQASDSSTTVTLGALNQAQGIDAARGVRLSSLLAIACGLVLLIACVNVANLLLARGIDRQRELALRTALGSSRGRLVRQLYLESGLLAGLGCSAGLVATLWAGPLLHAVLLPDFARPPLDARLLLFTLSVTVITILLAGLAPALHTTSPNLAVALKSGVREGGRRQSRVQRALLVGQVALTMILLTGAGLFLRSLAEVRALRLGFDPDRVIVASVDLGRIRPTRDAIQQEYEQMRQQAARVPGVELTALSIGLPFRMNIGVGLTAPGVDTIPEMNGPSLAGVTPDYLPALGTRVLRGRGFTAADAGGAPRVLVISQSVARAVWPGLDPLGRCLQLGGSNSPCREVVGVVEDGRQDRITEPAAQLFVPLAQADDSALMLPVSSLVIRTTGPAAAGVGAVRRAVQATAPDLPYVNLDPMSRFFADQVRPWQLGAQLFGLFGALALGLGAVGIYGVLSYLVSRRSHEMGIRLALGGRTGQVLGLVVGEGVGLALLGIGLGTAAALAAGRGLASLVYGVSPYDPVTLLGVGAILLSVATGASLLPGWRATRIDPMVALREE